MLSITSCWICRNLQSTWNALEDWFPSALHHCQRVTCDVTHGLTPKLSSQKQSFVNCFRSTKITEVNNYVHFGMIFVLAHEMELSINQPFQRHEIVLIRNHMEPWTITKKLNHHDSKPTNSLPPPLHLTLTFWLTATFDSKKKKDLPEQSLSKQTKREDIMRRPTKCWSWT